MLAAARLPRLLRPRRAGLLAGRTVARLPCPSSRSAHWEPPRALSESRRRVPVAGAALAALAADAPAAGLFSLPLRLPMSLAAPTALRMASSFSGLAAQASSAVVTIQGVLRARLPPGFGNFGEEGKERRRPPDDRSSEEERPLRKGASGKEGKEPKDGKEGDEPRKGNRESKDGDEPSGPGMTFVWVLLGSFVLLPFFATYWENSTGTREITFQEFRSRFLETNLASKIVVLDRKHAKTAVVFVKGEDGRDAAPQYHFVIGSVDSFERMLTDAQNALGIDPRQHVPVQYQPPSAFLDTVLTVVPVLLLAGLTLFLFSSAGLIGRGGGGGGGGGGPRSIFHVGRSNATLVTKENKVKTRFSDVAGLDEAKQEIMEFVKFLRAPEKFTRLGAKMPKGALLVGPPGTGKTLIARATAGEAGVPFFSTSGSDFMEMFVGVGSSRVRDLFRQARQSAPCIVFIDEIDAIGRARGRGFSGANDERDNTLNQLLVEMDGFNEKTGVVVLAGTNRPDILDSALVRPGRFDRKINIDRPDIRGRQQIFELHLKPLLIDPKLAVAKVAERLAALTPGFAGAEIANVCNEAALIAARGGKEQVEMADFEAATDRVIGGIEKKNKVMSAQEREVVAYHESGHAVCGWFLENADPLLKVTIIPRASALGFAQYLPQELNLYNKEQLLDRLCMMLGGRAAEQLFFHKISTGAADDLKRITQLSYGIVGVYGMSERIGNLSFPQEDGAEFTKPYSEATAQTMDEEAREIVRRAYDRTLKLLEEKRALVESLAKLLLKKETLNHEDIVSVLGPRPYGTTAYDEFVRHSKLAKEEQQPTSTAEGKADAPVGGEAKEKPAAGDEIPAVAAVTPVEHAQSPPATAAAAATAAATTASRKSDGDSAA